MPGIAGRCFRKPASGAPAPRASQRFFFSLEELADMRTPETEASRAENITAALVYLMTHYARTGCPRLPLCGSGATPGPAAPPDAPPVVRDICAGLHGAWSEAAGALAPPSGPLH